MSNIKPSAAFPAADWASGDVQAFLKAQVATFFATVDDLRNFDAEMTAWVFVNETGWHYRLDLASTAADDGVEVIHDANARRYLRANDADASSVVAAALAARDAAEGYRDEAEAFVAMATDARDIYPDAATGLAAVAEGKYFWVASTVAGEIAALYRDVAGVATDTGKRAPDATLTAALASQTFGRSPPVAATAWAAYLAIRPDEMVAAADGWLTEFSVYGANAGTLTLWVVTEWVDGADTKVKATAAATYAVAAGLATVTPNLKWLTGQKIVFRHTGTPHYTASVGGIADPGVKYASYTMVTDAAAGTILPSTNASIAMQAKAVWAGKVKGASDVVSADAAADSAILDEAAKLLGIADSGYRLTETATTAEHRAYATAHIPASTQVEAIIEVKGGGRRLWVYSNAVALIDAIIDAEAGSIVAGPSGYTQTLSIEKIGDGVVRAKIVVTTGGSSATTNFQLRLLNSGTTGSYAGDGVSGAWVQDVKFRPVGSSGNMVPADLTSSVWTKGGLATIALEDMGGDTLAARVAELEIASHPLAGKKVTMLGTSLVAQGVMPGAFASATGCTLQSLGSSGGALGLDARGSPHYGSGAVTALFSSINADAEAIILDGLPNDVAASDVPLGAIGDTTTATFYGALANFFTWCETNRPNAAVCVAITLPASATYSPSDYRHGVANANGNTLEEFQDAMRRACRYHGRPFIDATVFGMGFRDAGDDTSDGLHWDASGAARVAKIYAAETRRLCDAGWLDN